jgi:glycolate oxidase iron-sulfur subunit
MTISDHYDTIAQCNKCGFCQVACPIFRSSGHEAGVARGRLALLRALIEGRLNWSTDIEAPLFDCLLCGACTANCFPAIPTSELIVQARSQYLERVGRKPIHRLLFDCLLPYPNRLHWAARAVALGKNMGFSALARSIGLLRIFGRDFPQAEEIVERLPPQPFRGRHQPDVYAGQGDSVRIGYFVGCGVDILGQSAAEATLSLLRQKAKAVVILDNCCCGLPGWSYGDLKAARKLAEKNMNLLKEIPLDLIVTDCSSCASFLKKYPQLFSGDDPRHETAENMVPRVQDMVEWLAANPAAGDRPSRSVVVTYHDPCHACRGQGLMEEPREILKKTAGLEFRELPESDWCCGGAGSYALSNFALSRRVLDRKMQNVEKTAADVLVTSCPACMIHLSYGVRSHGLTTKVCHISEILRLDTGSFETQQRKRQ